MKKNTLLNQSGVKSQTQDDWSKIRLPRFEKMLNCDR